MPQRSGFFHSLRLFEFTIRILNLKSERLLSFALFIDSKKKFYTRSIYPSDLRNRDCARAYISCSIIADGNTVIIGGFNGPLTSYSVQ